EYSGELVAAPTWLVVVAMIPILLTMLALIVFALKEWGERRLARSSPVHAAAWAMEQRRTRPCDSGARPARVRLRHSNLSSRLAMWPMASVWSYPVKLRSRTSSWTGRTVAGT
ncbi:hypothetical protein R3Q16_32225, partial [Rhodococcus globerulus]|nr:hypothetical protein [Rhodococcus globerulus]